jgi:rod shape-determining protein MreD
VALYTLVLLLVQALWIARAGYPALRADLLLPLMCGVAVAWSALRSLAWAALWGFVGDTLSGKFWGFHVGSYVAMVCLVKLASDRIELRNPIYQMIVVGVCAVAQSMALYLFLVSQYPAVPEIVWSWHGFLIRSFIIMLIAPLINYPIGRIGPSS